MIRDDISDRLIHLTRGDNWEKAAEVFQIILSERKLRGSSKDIRGGYKCICFSEAPVAKIGYILANPAANNIRYSPFGIMISKKWLYEKGGRPVIYQHKSEYEILADDIKYRHVSYEPGVVDHTWEREWRIKIDELAIDPDETTVVVPNRKWEEKFQRAHLDMLQRRSMVLGNIGPRSLNKFPYHFVVLEDLGINIPESHVVKEI